jgi:hypothetical protein
MAKGVLASKVQNLFPETPTEGLAEEVAEPPEEEVAEQPAEEDPEELPPPEVQKPAPPTQPVRKKRVIGAKGAIIVHQDGKTVKVRKKCIKCGFENTSRTTLPIRVGVMRMSFFCPKCRRLQPVEITGAT